MSEPTTTYDAQDVIFNFGGLPLDSGFQSGDFITITPEADAFIDVVGVDGTVTRSKSNDNRATIQVMFMQKARGNTILSAMLELDKAAPNGAGIRPLMIKDANGTALHYGAKAWISRPPDVIYSQGASVRQWTFRVAELQRNDGGAISLPI